MIKFDRKWSKVGAVITNAVFTKCFLIYAGYWIGTKLDVKYGTSPYLMTTFIVLGMALGLTWIIIIANRVKF